MMRKIFITLGTALVVAAPVAITVSCGSSPKNTSTDEGEKVTTKTPTTDKKKAKYPENQEYFDVTG